MAQPACEQVVCERVPHRKIENCTPLSPRFQKSFADATVRDVAINGHRAAAKFSNGAVIELGGGSENQSFPGPAWLIDGIGGTAGRGFFDPTG